MRRLREDALPFLLDRPDGPPDLLLICAGYDALDSDPLAGMRLLPSDFAASITAICDGEFGFPSNKVALGLEGGYNLEEADGMPAALVATCAALLD